MTFEIRLDTRQAASYLTELGYRIAPTTLNKLRCVGGGPEFEKFGRRPLYSESSLLEWVQERTTDSLRSTSDPKNTAPPRTRPVEAHLIQGRQRPLSRSRKPTAASGAP